MEIGKQMDSDVYKSMVDRIVRLEKENHNLEIRIKSLYHALEITVKENEYYINKIMKLESAIGIPEDVENLLANPKSERPGWAFAFEL